MQNCVISARITSFYGSQPSSVDLCIQKRDFRTRIAYLYGSLTSPVILCMQNSVPSIRITSLYGSQPSSVAFACKTSTFGPELPASMGPFPHLWILIAKQRLLHQHTNLYGYKTSPIVLCMHNCVISTRITRLYGFQPSSVVLCI